MIRHENRVISDFAKEFNFDDIRPYYDHEVQPMLQRIIKDLIFMQLISNLWPEMTFEEVKKKSQNIHSSYEFQLEFMHAAIRKILELSSSGLSSDGFDQLDPNKSYLFIANHRDILLDAAILQVLLVEHGFKTSEISFGSNLREQGFITDFGKLNRMFTVLREGTSKELYEISRKLSAYIRHSILDKNVSVWIAQRNGRTKDGGDFTQSGLLKMLNISGKKHHFVENFNKLNIVPLSISYEYEPCDYLKTQEIYLSNLHTRYTKAPGEDLNSIVTGIRQFKGKIHMSVGAPFTEKELTAIDKFENENDKIKAFATIIDKKLYEQFKCNPVNYIAADLLEHSYKRAAKYTPEQKQGFVDYMSKNILKLTGEPEVLEHVFLKIYATPVLNKGE
ncbi:MAG: glycerol acyltransferase [bacterium]|nr:glycerol acyltransferase [bacterium]